MILLIITPSPSLTHGSPWWTLSTNIVSQNEMNGVVPLWHDYTDPYLMTYILTQQVKGAHRHALFELLAPTTDEQTGWSLLIILQRISCSCFVKSWLCQAPWISPAVITNEGPLQNLIPIILQHSLCACVVSWSHSVHTFTSLSFQEKTVAPCFWVESALSRQSSLQNQHRGCQVRLWNDMSWIQTDARSVLMPACVCACSRNVERHH